MIFHICICQFIKVVLMDYKEGAVRVVCNRCESSRQTLARVGREAGRSLRNFFLFSFFFFSNSAERKFLSLWIVRVHAHVHATRTGEIIIRRNGKFG